MEIDILEQTLLQQLRQQEKLTDIQFDTALENRRVGRQNRVCVWLKLSPARFVPASLDSSLRQVELTISLWISAPRTLGGGACVDAFSRVSDALLFGENGLCLQTVSCEKTEYSEAAGAFRMEGQVGMTAYCRKGGG